MTTCNHRPLQFDCWPAKYRTKNNWASACREIIPGQHPVAQHGEFHNSETNDGVLERVFHPDANLFSSDQTRPMTGRKLALQRFANLFLATARKDSYAIEDHRKYSTKTAIEGVRSTFLSVQHVKNHFNNPHKTLHLKATNLTQWLRIDLDCHEGKVDPNVFIERARRLLTVCHGDGWHQEVNDPFITGIHFTKFFAKPHRLSEVHEYAERLLAMAGVTDIEIYPQENHSCRCPGDPNRLLILDRIVEPIVVRKKRATNVEYYRQWLKNPNRQYLPADRILSYLMMNTPGLWGQHSKADTPISSGSILLVVKNKQFTDFHRKTWRIVTDFWSGRNCPKGSLDEILPVTIRVAQSQGYDDQQIIEGINYLCDQMPFPGRGCSSRLENTPNARRKLHNDIERKVQYMSDGGGQRKPEESREILSQCKWRGDIFDPATWEQPKPSYGLQDGSCRLTAEQLAEIGTDFVAAFPKKYRTIANRRLNDIVSAMAKLAAIKSKEENGIVYGYWQKFFLDQFKLDLKLTNLKKVLMAARKLGIIRLISKLGRSNVYQPGSLLPISSGSILLVVKKDHLTTKKLVEMERKLNEIVGMSGNHRQIVHTIK